MTPAWRDAAAGPVEAEDRLWGGRRWTAVGAVVFVAVVAVLAVIVLLPKGHPARPGDTARRDGAGPASGVGGGTSSGPAAAGGVPLTAAPAGVVWRLVDGVALPFSTAGDGPGSVAGGVAAGFSHSPAGALLAGVQTAFRIGAVNPAAQAAVVQAMVIGAGRAGLLASRPASVPAVKPQLAGFRYLSYSPAAAVIDLAERVTDVAAGTSKFVDVGELQLAWSGGDWRLVDDGSQPPLPSVLDAGLTGFVPFAGA